MILNNDERSEVETTTEKTIITDSRIFNGTVDFISNDGTNFIKTLDKKPNLILSDEKNFTTPKSKNSGNYSRKNTNLAFEYREKSEKPPHTYIKLIAEAIQVI